MNKIFKVIWNHATQSWIVTSEISKSHGKTASSKSGGFAISHISGVRFAYTAVASTLLFVLSGTALAATVTDGTGTNSIIIKGATSTATQLQEPILWRQVLTLQLMEQVHLLFTNSAATGLNATAYGNMAKATANTATAFGSLSEATAQSATAVGDGAKATAGQTTAVGVGTAASKAGATAVGHNSQATADHATALGSIANASAARTVAVGYNVTASQTDAVAVGSNAIANQANAVAVGVNAKAQNNSNIAIGNLANATGATSAISIGRESAAAGTSAVAMGYKAQASGTSAIAVGSGSLANGISAIAVGSGSLASGISAISIGNGSDAAGERTTVIGSRNGNVAASYSAIIGIGNAITSTTDVQVYGNTNTISRSNTYVLGSNNTVSGATESAVIAGRQNTMSGTNGVAVGRLNTVAGSSAVAIGQSSQALGTDGIALGNKAYANTGQNAIALGGLTHAGQFGTALGARASVKGDQGLAAATGAVVEGARAMAVGSYSFAGTEDAVALGHNTAATGSRAVAIGAGSVVSGARSGAWGIATNGGQPQNNTTDRSFVGGTDSYAIGNKNIIGNTSSDSFVLGNNVKLGATGASIAITDVAGKDSTTNASTRTNTVNYTGATAITGAVALGSDTSVAVNNGVALGKSSVAGTAAGQVGADPLSAVTDKTSAVWTSTLSAVSVGDIANNKTRQITSVAAGTQDTDAVNVAQLKAAGFTLAASNAGGGESTTVANDKIQNGETVTVDAGKNIKVTHTANTVSIATKDKVEFTQITLGDSTNNTVLTSTADGLDVGGDKITNVADGSVSANSKDAINGSQLYTTNQNVANNATAIANNATEIAKGLNFGANDQTATSNTAINRKLGDTIGIKGGITDTSTATSGENVITRTDANGNINIELAKNAKFDSVTTGGTKLSDAGLSFVDASGSPVANSPSISKTGINAGNQVIAGVKTGVADTDAVNVAQLNDKTATTPLTVGNTGVVDTPATTDANKLATAGDIANAINKAGFTLTTAKTTDGELGANSTSNELINAGDTVTVEADKNIKVTQTNGKISIATKDAVNFNNVTAGSGANQVVLGDDGVKVGGKTYISDAGLNANDKKITNVANGNVTSTSKEAINGSQLHNTADDIASIIGGNATVDNAGNVTASNIGGTGKGNINDAIQTVNTKADANATEIAKGLNFGANDQTATSNTAINRKLGETIGIKGGITDTTTATSGENVITRTDANGNINIELAKNAKFDSVTTGGTKLSDAGLSFVDASGSPVANSPSISKTGINAGNQVIAGVKAGTQDTDAVNVSQLKGAVDALGGGATINTDGTIKAPTYSITNPANGTVTTANNVGDALKGLNDAVNSPLTFKGDSGEFNRNLGQTTTVKGGITDTAKLSDNNIGVVAKDGTLDIKLAKDIAVDSVKAGDTTVNTYGVSIANADPNKVVSLTASGLNNGNNRITNVAAGQAGTDAVNKDQLDKAKAAATTKVANGKNVKVTEQNNTDGSKTYTVATADEVEFNKATVGGVVVDGTSNKVSGLANGDVSATSTDAINGSQLFATNQNVANNAALIAKGINFGGTTGSNNYALGDTINVKGDSNISSETVAGGVQLKLNDVVSIGTAKPVKIDGTNGTVGGLTNTTWDANNIVSGQAATEDQLKSAVAAAQAAATTKVVEGKNVKVSEQTNADGSKTYTVATKDDVNFNNVTAGTGANQVVLGDDGVKVGGKTYISDAGLNANDKKIINVANGDVTLTSKDAINGSQLFAQGEGVKNIIGGTTTYDPTTGTYTNNNIGGTGKGNINDAIQAVNTAATKAKTTVTQGKNIVVTETTNTDGSTNYQVATADNLDVTSVKAGNTTINNAGVTVGNNVALTDSGLSAGNVKVTTDGINAGDNKITGVAAGDISATSTDAVNGSQLDAVNQRILNIITGGKDKDYYDANGNLTEAGKVALTTYNVSGQTEFVHNSVISAIQQMNNEGIKYFHTNDGQTSVIQNANSQDSSASGKYATAVGYQANSSGENATAMGSSLTVTTDTQTAGATITTVTENGQTVLKQRTTASGARAVALGAGSQALGDDSIAIGTGNVVTGQGSGAIGDPSVINGANSYSVGNNNSIAASSDNVFILGNDVNIAANTSGAVALGNKASVTTAGSVALGEGSTAGAANIAGGTANNAYTFGAYNDANVAAKPTTSTSVVAVGSKGNERQIQHVAAGVVSATSTDAINGSQLYYTNRALGKLADVVNKNNLDLRAGIAGANAAAGLPQVYLPGKSMVAASAGTYRGQSALAVGYSRSSDNGKLVLKVQGNANTRGEVGGSVGIGYQW